MELSGCYFLFIRWVLYKTHPGPSPGLASHWVGIDDTCFIHSFVLQISVDTCCVSGTDGAVAEMVPVPQELQLSSGMQ